MPVRFVSSLLSLASLALGACAAAPTPARASLPAANVGNHEASAPARPVATADPATTEASLASPRSGPGWLGVGLAKREQQPGALIRYVQRDSPAARAGIASGDVVLSLNGENIEGPLQLHERIKAAHPGARITLGVLRGDNTRLFAAELETQPNDTELMRKSYVGAPAPAFGALTTVQGSITPSLPALKGRVVVLEFWASWCGICHVLAPTLNGWHDRYSAQGVTVLGVTTDPVDLAGRTAGQLGMGYALASDTTGGMQRAYQAFALPTLFVIDKQGNVRDVLIGYSTPRLHEIEALVRKLIAEG